jgi:hypothetical protein
MKYRLVFTLALISISGLGHSQSLDLGVDGNQLIVKNSSKYELEYLPSEDFQQLDWQAGYAYYLDGSSRKFDGMKYDPELDRIQVSAEGNVLTLLPGVINGVSMETDESISRIFVKVPLDKPVFMEALSVGNIHLLIYRRVKDEGLDFYQRTDATQIKVDEQEAPPVQYDEYIYSWGSKGVKKFKPSKKAILSLMNDHAEEVEAFLDDEGIKGKNISDLMKLFDYYNGLN